MGLHSQISRRPFFLFALCAALLFVSVAAEVAYEKKVRFASWYDAGVQLPLPSPEWFARASFGFRNAVADVLWIDAVQIFTRWDAKSPGFPDHFDAIAALQPRFEYPYLFGVLVLPGYGGEKFLERARMLAERGMAALPDDWKIPFYLGVQYHIVGKDYEKALIYVNRAADNPLAPPVVVAMRAIYAAHAGSIDAARALLVAMEKTATDDFTRETARLWIERIDFLESAQEAARRYKLQNGFLPKDIAELSRLGFLPKDSAAKYSDIIIRQDGVVIFQK